MKLFECQNCGQVLYFENTSCESCGLRLGYLPEREVLSALESVDGVWRALAVSGEHYRFCANAEHNVCNWLVSTATGSHSAPPAVTTAPSPTSPAPGNLEHWRKLESAKHRLFYTLLRLRLPLTTRDEDADGLAFDFLSGLGGAPAGAPPVMTGHAGGLVTLNVEEADDPERERRRKSMREPYRTLLGHFRHEIAHYYWDRLVAPTPAIDEFREMFGDEREDYAAALERYYADGPASDWSEHYVTAYASAHPWEDFAETWAHYFHMVDTLETAGAFGLRLRPKVAKSSDLSMVIDFDPHTAEMDRIIDAWLPLTFAVNSINRSMGQPDLYPFVLPPPVIWKLTFVHNRVHAVSASRPHGFAPACVARHRCRAQSVRSARRLRPSEKPAPSALASCVRRSASPEPNVPPLRPAGHRGRSAARELH